MPVTGAFQFGGHVFLSAGAGTTTLKWGAVRKVQIITPTVALADVRLPDADKLEFQPDHGIGMFYIANASGSNSIRLRDQEGRVDLTLAVARAAIVSRYIASGTPYFFADLREFL
jgi:hypothetical protein